MYCIQVDNVNQGLAAGLRAVVNMGVEQPSRNGPVLVMPEPVATTYLRPTNRVLFSAERDANPFFHFMEALWMLAGHNDVDFPAHFVKRMKVYSDDGLSLHGAYGYRWRQHWGFDQLHLIIDQLKHDPYSRRAVLAMWDPPDDLNKWDGKDIPCNTHAYFGIMNGALNMTVCCRSNDIWWGCYGANAVHFSMLLEYMAAALGVQVGSYTQVSNNFHLYTDVVKLGDSKKERIANMDDLCHNIQRADLYTRPHSRGGAVVPVKPTDPMALRQVGLVMVTQKYFDKDLATFMEFPENTAAMYQEPIFQLVALPMYQAWEAYKDERYHDAMEWAEKIYAGDWSRACCEWLERRNKVRQEQAHMEGGK